MEILVPVDLQFEANRIKTLQAKMIEEFSEEVKRIVPVGYTLEVDKSNDVSVYKSREDKEDRFFYPDKLVYKFARHTLSLGSTITANDIYRLNGIMQLMATADLGLLGPIVIEK